MDGGREQCRHRTRDRSGVITFVTVERTPSSASSVLTLGRREWRRLVSDVDSAELKILLADPESAATLAGQRRSRRRKRALYLVDTAGLLLVRSGVEVRLRRRGRRDDVIVRTRRPVRDPAPRPDGGRVELDMLPSATLRTTQLRHVLDARTATRCLEGGLTSSALLTGEQRRWLEQVCHTPLPPTLGPLVAHGPIHVERTRIPREHFPIARAHVELCTLPSGRVITEFSARCHPEESAEVAAAAWEFLLARDIAPAESHTTKTALLIDEIADAEGLPDVPRPR